MPTQEERVVQEMQVRPEEFFKTLGTDTYRRAYEQGMGLSAYLEQEMPSEDFPEDKLDAYQRLMRVANIRTRSLPEYGVLADDWEVFHASPSSRALVPEFIRRQWLQAAYGRNISTRGMYTSSDTPASQVYTDSAQIRIQPQIGPAIPVNELIAINTGIDTDSYRTFYLIDDPAESRMVRVGETAEMPSAHLERAERTVQVYKYGRVLRASYEALRRLKIDRVALHIQRMAVQSEIDKVSTIIDVLVNGDGNVGTTPAEWNLIAQLDPAATADKLTLKAYIAYKMKFVNPYVLTTMLMREDIALQVALLDSGTGNIPLVVAFPSQFGQLTPINNGLRDGVAFGWTPDAPAGFIVGFDKRFALERVFEVGAEITEVDRYITNQTNVIAMSMVEGYATLDPNAIKLLDVFEA